MNFSLRPKMEGGAGGGLGGSPTLAPVRFRNDPPGKGSARAGNGHFFHRHHGTHNRHGGHRTNLFEDPRQHGPRKMAILTRNGEPDFRGRRGKNPSKDVASGRRSTKSTYRSKLSENFTLEVALIYDQLISYGGHFHGTNCASWLSNREEEQSTDQSFERIQFEPDREGTHTTVRGLVVWVPHGAKQR